MTPRRFGIALLDYLVFNGALLLIAELAIRVTGMQQFIALLAVFTPGHAIRALVEHRLRRRREQAAPHSQVASTT